MPALTPPNATRDHASTEMREELSLDSIRRSVETTSRGRDRKPLQREQLSTELELYLNQIMFDLSLRLDAVERYLKDESRLGAAPADILGQIPEMLKELRLCSDISNFAISKLTPRS